MLLMAAATALMLYRFFKLSEGSLWKLCWGADICISEYLLCPTLLLTLTSAAER